MSLSVQIGLLLSIGTAFGSVLGFLYKQRGAVAAPAVEISKPIRSTIALFKSPWYLVGIAVALGSWGLHVGALALAPISLVQATIAGGLVLLTVTADRLFGFKVTRREWVGVALAAAGLAFLAATLGDTGSEAHSGYETSRLVVWVAVVSGFATLVGLVAGELRRAGLLLGISAGLWWAASDTSIKALSDELGAAGPLEILFSPLALVIFVASFIGLLVSARSLQIGKPVEVIAVTSVAANVTTIASGPIVFAEPFPSDPLGVALRLAAFALVIGAAALIPAPRSGTEPAATTAEAPGRA
ncbi:hypothetical protein HJD18_05020 [Thermoleophilia bacterium SCSIO 60948]|nr:hypothetical protein HJD18_05020 [Thermoleophilia bacterium SCSIO 60948]